MAKSIRSKAKRKNRTEFRKTIGTVSVQLDREMMIHRDEPHSNIFFIRPVSYYRQRQ